MIVTEQSTVPGSTQVRAIPSLVEELLRDQQELTAVERFSQAYDQRRAGGVSPLILSSFSNANGFAGSDDKNEKVDTHWSRGDAGTEEKNQGAYAPRSPGNGHSANRPLQAKYYQSLLPARNPSAGEQYAFEVDLDRCSGCKACVTACHALNGLDEHETWRDVGLLVGGTTSLPVIQHVTAACHHCLQPACMEVCPTLAYEKDARTGIVKHLDDQCFGCQYCILACPYDVPKYHAGKGIVRKCDMCSQRLAVGEAPACVQACPHEAIRIQLVSKEDVAADCEATNFLPAAPDPQVTQPTTTYKTNRVFPRNMIPADYYSVHAEEAHLPLIVMLVLTQLSVGACFVNAWLYSGEVSNVLESVRSWQTLTAVGFGLLALAASTLHLGRPHLAWRAVLGLKRSWLSREIVAFGLFAAVAVAYAVGEFLFGNAELSGNPIWNRVRQGVLASGLLGVLCSVMIYYRTRRPTWGSTRTLWRFLGTSVWLGLVATLFAAMVAVGFRSELDLNVVMNELLSRLGRPLLICAAAKLLYEATDLLHIFDRHQTPLKRMAQLLTGDLSGLATARFALGLLGGLLLPGLLMAEVDQPSTVKWYATVTALFAMSVIGELLERTLFFMTAVTNRMPGAVRT